MMNTTPHRNDGEEPVDDKTSQQKDDMQFIGRGEELQLLRHTYEDLVKHEEGKNSPEKQLLLEDSNNEQEEHNLPTVTLIHGDSGTGKSTLVYRLLDELKEKQKDSDGEQEASHLSLIGKYYESEHSGPFCGIITALNNFTASLHENDAKSLRESALSALGPTEMMILLAFLPGLTAFFNREQVDGAVSSYGDTDGTMDTSMMTTSCRTSYRSSVGSKSRSSILSTSFQHSSYRKSSMSSRNSASIVSTACRGSAFNNKRRRSSIAPYPDSRRLSALWGSDPAQDNDFLHSSVRSDYSEATSESESASETSDVSPSVPQENVWNRLKFIIYTFVNVIMKMNRPVIIFIDDLQWADKESLDFIKSLLTDKSLTNLMFIGTCRQNKDECVDVSIKDVFTKRDTNYINLNNLSIEDTNNFLLEALQLSETNDVLSKMVYKKTNGNLLLIKQLLEELIKKKVLTFSESAKCWELNKSNNTSMDPFDKKILSVEAKVHGCSEDLKNALIVASFAGCDFEEFVLQIILDEIEGCGPISKVNDLCQALEEGVASGLLVFREDTERYYFAHDRIYEATIALLQHKDRERRIIQGKIGVCLYEMYLSKIGEDWMLLVATNNINSGLTNIDFTKKAKLNLVAGRSSLSTASYRKAEKFFKHGIHALTRTGSHWTTEYKLSLLLFRGLVDAKFCLDDEYEGMKYAREILKRSTMIDDKIPTFVCIATFQARKDNPLQSLNSTISAVTELGDLPKDNQYFHSLKGFLYIKRWFHNHSEDHILKLPLINDHHKHQRIKLIMKGYFSSLYCGKSVEWILFIAQGLRLSLKFGLCGETVLLMNSCACAAKIMGDHRLAMRFVYLGRKLIKSIPVNESTCWAYCGYSTWYFPWSSAGSDMLLLAMEGYRLAMEFGSFDSAAGNRFSLIGIAFSIGYPLAMMKKSCEETLNHFGIYDIQMGMIQTDQYRQLTYWLTEQLEIDWKDVESFGPDPEVECDLHRCLVGYVLRLTLTLIFGKYEIAKTMAKKSKTIIKQSPGLFTHFIEIQRLCFSFLTKAGLAHRTGKMKYRRKALKMAKSIKACTQSKGDTSRHVELLIDAEVIALGKPKVKKIVHAHKVAVLEAISSGFTQYAAVGLELAGEHMLRLGKENLAGDFFSQARDCYLEWGASAKVKQMERSRIAYLDQPGKEPVIPSLSKHFAANKEKHNADFLSLDFRLSESEKNQLLDRLK